MDANSNSLNVKLFYLINSNQLPILNAFFIAITETAYPVIALITLLLLWKKRELGIKAFISLAITAIMVFVLKRLINEPRPFETLQGVNLLVSKPDSSSFPSGHSSLAFSLATTIALSDLRKEVKIIVLLWAVLVAISRIYVGVHYPLDVIAGALIGVSVSYVVNKFFRNLKELVPFNVVSK